MKGSPRRRYPSDEPERRGRRGRYFRVYLDVADHPRTRELWSNPTTRGMLVELWRIADLQAAKNSDGWVHLGHRELVAITGKKKIDWQFAQLRIVAESARFQLHMDGHSVSIRIDNFAEVQGLTPLSVRNSAGLLLPTKEEQTSSTEKQSSKNEITRGLGDGAELQNAPRSAVADSTPPPPSPPKVKTDPEIVEICHASVYFKALGDDRYGEFWQTAERAYFADPSPVVLQTELDKADAWLAANPSKRPTERGLSRFFRNWLERSVEIERRKVETIRTSRPVYRHRW